MVREDANQERAGNYGNDWSDSNKELSVLSALGGTGGEVVERPSLPIL